VPPGSLPGHHSFKRKMVIGGLAASGNPGYIYGPGYGGGVSVGGLRVGRGVAVGGTGVDVGGGSCVQVGKGVRVGGSGVGVALFGRGVSVAVGVNPMVGVDASVGDSVAVDEEVTTYVGVF